MNTKLAAAITSLGIAASSLGVVGLKENCAFDELVLDIPMEKTRICFEKEDDYQIYKGDILEKFEQNLQKSRPKTLGYFETLEEYHQFIALVNEEKKRGNITSQDVLTNESMKIKILSLTN